MEPPLPDSSLNEKNKKLLDCSPLSWTEFFERREQLDIDGDLFNVYFKGTQGPVFYLLHGGGYTGLTWSCFSEHLSAKIDCQIIAPDLRAHGETVTEDVDDLSVQRQMQDVSNIYAKIYGKAAAPPLVVVGHSMGGALAVHVVHAKLLPNVMAMAGPYREAVIDVVEGSALSALSAMPGFLRGRPQQFPSVERAVRWCLESGTTINKRAARVSMPAQIHQVQIPDQPKVYIWRTNLFKTQAYWHGWFQGLSQKFLECSGAKILILANVESLDKKMLTGQMKGMFQTEVLPKVGHAVHEDSPKEVAQIFVNLVNRYKVLFDKAKTSALQDWPEGGGLTRLDCTTSATERRLHCNEILGFLQDRIFRAIALLLVPLTMAILCSVWTPSAILLYYLLCLEIGSNASPTFASSMAIGNYDLNCVPSLSTLFSTSIIGETKSIRILYSFLFLLLNILPIGYTGLRLPMPETALPWSLLGFLCRGWSHFKNRKKLTFLKILDKMDSRFCVPKPN